MALPLPGGPDPDPARQQKFDAIARAMPSYGGKSVEERFGLITVTWPGASTSSNTATAAHGLGRIPVSVTATLNSFAGSGACVVVAAFDATNVTVQLFNTGGFSPGAAVTNPVSWRAVG